jgi:hypothetical protein
VTPFPRLRNVRRPLLRVVIASLALCGFMTPLVSSVTGTSSGAATKGIQSLAQSVPLSVGVTRCTFVDHSRGALNYSTKPFSMWSRSRTLVTEIRYPTQYVAGGPTEIPGATPLAPGGGYPMIVFAHGYDVTPDTYAPLLDAWARDGFVVVAPFFPDEQPSEIAAQHGVNTEDDLVNEPADLAFVTRSIIQASAAVSPTCPVVSGLIQPTEIALAGHSDGAQAVGMLAFDHGDDPQGTNYGDLRSGISYRAVIILSGAEDTAQSYAAEASHPNLLVIQSLADQCNQFHNDVTLYNAIHQPNKWFLVLRTAHHLPPFDGDDAPAFRVVAATTDRFLELSLEKAATPSGLSSVANQDPSVARLYSGSPGPSQNLAPVIAEKCGPN